MGGDGLVVKKARTHVHDAHRNVFLNRGMFVKAPPQFFQFYGSDFEPLTPKESRLVADTPSIRLKTFNEWGGKEQVPVAAEIVEQPVAAAVPEAVAAAPEAQVDLPVKTKKPRTASRKVVLR